MKYTCIWGVILTNTIIFKLNKSIGLNLIFSVCYIFLDRCFIQINEAKSEYVVELTPKKTDPQIQQDFSKELNRLAFYHVQSRATMPLRILLLRRILNIDANIYVDNNILDQITKLDNLLQNGN